MVLLALDAGGAVSEPDAGAVWVEIRYCQAVVPELMFHILLHPVERSLGRDVAQGIALQRCERVGGGVQLGWSRSAFVQGVHQPVLKEVIKLGKIRLGQTADQERKACRLVYKQHAVAALQGNQIGVPTAQWAVARIVGSAGTGSGVRQQAEGVYRQFGEELLGAMQLNHRSSAQPWGQIGLSS